jgi:hypothetical protein
MIVSQTVRWFIAGFVVMVGGSASAQIVPSLTILPFEQASRDATRQQILEAELKAELAGVVKARQRASERRQAADQVGLAEALEALRQHNVNVTALRREIESTAAPRRTLPSVVARDSSAVRDSSVTQVFVRVAPPSKVVRVSTHTGPKSAVPRAWDMYAARGSAAPEGNADVAPLIEQAAPGATPVLAAESATLPPAWDMYRKRAAVSAATNVAKPSAERIVARPRETPTVPYLVYRDPNAVVRVRFPETTSNNRN